MEDAAEALRKAPNETPPYSQRKPNPQTTREGEEGVMKPSY
ncbi:hypothetical protein [Caldivirga sp.]|nr:hypothetical protein [Caldivirga sp.]